ncbi:MAG: ECF-type sigma factor [Phycisphaerales bacterium]
MVHEAYLKLVRPGISYQSRLHFYHTAAMAMRRILIDHAEARMTLKRGGQRRREGLSAVDAAAPGSDTSPIDTIALNEALEELAATCPRQAEVVNLRFFAGLNDADIAEMLAVSDKTVRRDWACARLWLFDRIKN